MDRCGSDSNKPTSTLRPLHTHSNTHSSSTTHTFRDPHKHNLLLSSSEALHTHTSTRTMYQSSLEHVSLQDALKYCPLLAGFYKLNGEKYSTHKFVERVLQDGLHAIHGFACLLPFDKVCSFMFTLVFITLTHTHTPHIPPIQAAHWDYNMDINDCSSIMRVPTMEVVHQHPTQELLYSPTFVIQHDE